MVNKRRYILKKKRGLVACAMTSFRMCSYEVEFLRNYGSGCTTKGLRLLLREAGFIDPRIAGCERCQRLVLAGREVFVCKHKEG